MNPNSQSPQKKIWVLESSGFIKKISPDLQNIRAFLDPAEMAQAIEAGHSPWLFITDDSGISEITSDEDSLDGKTAAEFMREHLPLTMIMLVNSDADPEVIEDLQKESILDGVVEGSRLRDIVELAGHWHERWNLPVAQRMRDHIENQGDLAYVKAVPHDDDRKLSENDIYREIIKLTPFGEVMERAWDGILKPTNQQPAPQHAGLS